MDLQEPAPGRLGRAGYGIGAQTILITDTAPQAAMAIDTYFDQGLFAPGSLLFDDQVTCMGEQGAKETVDIRYTTFSGTRGVTGFRLDICPGLRPLSESSCASLQLSMIYMSATFGYKWPGLYVYNPRGGSCE